MGQMFGEFSRRRNVGQDLFRRRRLVKTRSRTKLSCPVFRSAKAREMWILIVKTHSKLGKTEHRCSASCSCRARQRSPA